MKKNKQIDNKYKLLKVSVMILLFVILCILGVVFKYLKEDIIYGNVKINNIDVSGLEKNEAIDLLKKELKNDILNTELKLKYEEYEKKFYLKDIGADYNYNQIIEKVFKKGKYDDPLHVIFNYFVMTNNSHFYYMNINFDEIKLEKIYQDISEDLERSPKDAQLEINNGEFKIIEETIGIVVDKYSLFSLIEQSIKDEEFDILIPIKEIRPKIVKETLDEIDGRIATFTTYFSKENINRVKNIQIATQAIDRSILCGKEELSFNEKTGNRIKENGYFLADIIINGKLVQGYGGGVCQVSTTLYNVALLSDLEIIERYHHSIPSSYIDKGKDATVSYGYLDLKIRNPYNTPIYIQGLFYDDNIVFNVYGNKNKFDKKIKVESEIIEEVDYDIKTEIDKTLVSGEKKVIQQGRKGYKVKTYKTIYKDDKKIDKILLSNDYYKPKDKIVRVGPKE